MQLFLLLVNFYCPKLATQKFEEFLCKSKVKSQKKSDPTFAFKWKVHFELIIFARVNSEQEGCAKCFAVTY